MRIKAKRFDNGDQVRFKKAIWGSPETLEDPGSENLPLKMDFEWTKYYDTHLTNFNTDYVINEETKETVEDRLWTDITDMGVPSPYSDPFTTNLSVITSDNYIFLKTRGSVCAGNPGTLERGNYSIQPAVSGSGSRADIDPETHQYDPFATAIREAREEILGQSSIVPDSDISITFFGLARIWRTRFPFLFGEIRLKNTTSDIIKNVNPQTNWEGRPIAIEFTVEKVTDWIRSNYFDSPVSQYATTYFSLLQSLIYAYPDRIPEINRRLSLLNTPIDK